VTFDPTAGGVVAEPVRVRRLTDRERQKLSKEHARVRSEKGIRWGGRPITAAA
jgi:hypothetical protein